MKSPQALIGGSGRENIAVQTCINGLGNILPPYIIFTGKYLMANCTEGGAIGTRYAVSPNGWMTTPSYIDWLKTYLYHPFPQRDPSY